jgi:hypothetical protein
LHIRRGSSIKRWQCAHLRLLANERVQHPNHRSMNWKTGRRPTGMRGGGEGINASAFKPPL